MLVKIELYHDGETWCAKGIGEDIFTQGSTLDEAFANIKEAVALHFDEPEQPINILVLSEISLGSAKTTAS
ncbi:MAG: type II toxin-antitoxin system HicB family antitoxin [Dehalococcoidia bacterium]|nr:type II toxin-antitoxin system HicB family antitoxin [Dehalococcoidia bacterium]